jgi:hypothetical protein
MFSAMVVNEVDPWTLQGADVDALAFSEGVLGSYRVGPTRRRTAFGEVVLGLAEDRARLVELDIYDVARGHARGPTLHHDLTAAAVVRHKRIHPIIGVGVEDDVPYVVRPLRLGRTLAELEAAEGLDDDVAIVIIHALAEALRHLIKGDTPALGGFDTRDVYLTFDGQVLLTGLGLAALRPALEGELVDELRVLAASSEEPNLTLDVRDPIAFFELAQRLLRVAGPEALDEAEDRKSSSIDQRIRILERSMRRYHGTVLATGARCVGRALRRTFAESVEDERTFFGLPGIH